jgi:hypothetical protein
VSERKLRTGNVHFFFLAEQTERGMKHCEFRNLTRDFLIYAHVNSNHNDINVLLILHY